MSIRIPTNVDPGVRDALYDVEQRLRELETQLSDSSESDSIASEIEDLKAQLDLLRTKPKSPDYRDIMVASGGMHSPGLVPDPPATPGTTKFLREDGTWVAVVGGGGTSPLTTKGDIWGYTTTDARVGVGTNDTVLKADSGEAAGVIWEKVAASETTFAATTQINADDVQEAIDELGATHGLVNIKYVPPGSGTLTTAVAAMSNGDVLVLGSGTYTVTTIDIPDAVVEFAILGSGVGVTVINVTGGGIGINAADARRNKAVLQGFTLQPTTQNGTWGIHVWGRSQNSYVNNHIVIRNVSIERSSTPYWWTSGGVRIENCFEAVVENVSFRNKPSDYVGVGIQLESSVVCNILSCHVTETSIAFKIMRDPDWTRVENAISGGDDADQYYHGCEGNRFYGCEAYITDYGWWLDTRSLDNVFDSGTLAACRTNGVIDTGAGVLTLSGYNALFGTWVDGLTASNAAGVAAIMQGWKIQGNTFNGPNDTSKDAAGVAFAADTADRAIIVGNNFRLLDYGVYNNGADNCIINNNIFESMTANDTGIYILAGGNSNICVNNQYYNSPGYTDGGTSNIFSAVPAAHAVESAGGYHTASGLTTGHVLKATAATTFAFGALAAGSVTNTAAGNIVATDVQAAINELDTEKVAKAGDTMTGDLTLESATSSKPDLIIKNTNADSDQPHISFQKLSASAADADYLGSIRWYGYNDAGSPETILYGVMRANSIDISDGTEDGRLEFMGITGGSTPAFGSITGSTPASESPGVYAYFKPITAKYRADTSSSTFLVWDTTVAADAKITVASTTNVTVSEAGTYHVGCNVTLTLNNTTANVSLFRYNSSDAQQEQTNVCLETSANRTTTGTFSEVYVCAAGDYFKVSHDAGTVTNNDVYNQFSIQRLN